MQCLTGDLQSKSAERGIVVIIFFPTHPLPGSGLVANHERGDFEAVLGQALLIRVGTILRAAIRLMNAAFGRLAQCHSHVQRPDSEIAFHRLLTIAQQGHAKHDPERGGAADNAARYRSRMTAPFSHNGYSQPSLVQM